jgi:hypothetical protein
MAEQLGGKVFTMEPTMAAVVTAAAVTAAAAATG